MTWRGILTEAKFPTDVLMLDFEAYFDSEYHMGWDKKALSTVEYVADPRFEILGFGFQVLGHRWASLGRRFVPQPKVNAAFETFKQQFGKALHNCTVVAKNCKFDMLILAEKFGLHPPYTIDVEDLSRTFDARMKHDLKSLAITFGLPHKGDTSQFKGQHFADLNLRAMEGYCLRDIELQVELFKRLLPLVVDPKAELRVAAHTLRLYTMPKAHYDFELAAKLRSEMHDLIHKAVRDVAPWIMGQLGFTEEDVTVAFDTDAYRDIVSEELSKDLRFVRHLRAALPESEAIPTKPGKPSKNMTPITGEGRIPALAKDDEGCKALLGHTHELVQRLMAGRMAIKSWPLHIGRIDKMEAQARASRGLVRVPLKYYGAHTGRWSGEEKINLGNLGGAGRGKAISKLIGQVRHTIRAAPGHVFVLVDSAQIEARKLAWFANQVDLLEEFRNDGDPYSSLASELFQCRVWKWRKTDVEEYPGQEKKITIYRGFGKDAILGCGYGMGASKFFDRCYTNDELRPHFDNGEYNRAFIEKLIKTYRCKYSCIPTFWNRVEKAWRLATKYPGHEEDIDGRLLFWHKAGTTFMRLPSGRIMRYRDARVNADGDLFSSSCISPTNARGKLWGGHLTENIVQASSRDPLRDWILEIEYGRDIPVVHHVYDEIVCMVPEAEAESAMNAMIEVMETAPAWAEGMPYKAKGEGKISPYYTK